MEKSNMNNIFENSRIKISGSKKKTHYLLKISGAVNIYTVAPIKNHIFDILNNSSKLVINLAEVSEIDSAGFQILLMVKREGHSSKKKTKFISHSISILGALDIFGAVGLFGDQIVVPAEVRKKFSFTYGLKRQKLYPN